LLSRTVLDAPWSVSVFRLTCSLHWLPVKQQIHYKVGLLGFKAKHLLLPPYPFELLPDCQPVRHLWSSSAFLFSEPAVASYFASRTFSAAVPLVWNSLEPYLQSAPSLVSFKSRLKTALFSVVYSTQHSSLPRSASDLHVTLGAI